MLSSEGIETLGALFFYCQHYDGDRFWDHSVLYFFRYHSGGIEWPEVGDRVGRYVLQKYHFQVFTFFALLGIPSFFSTVLFAMEGIGTIMPVENSMVEPTFLGCPGVLNSAMSAVVCLYTAIGFFGYYRYGDATEDTISKNLPSGEMWVY